LWIEGLKPSEAAKKWAAMRDDYNTPERDRFPSGGVSSVWTTMIELVDQDTWDQLDATVEYWVDQSETDRRMEIAANG
jgi:hypothetical protein